MAQCACCNEPISSLTEAVCWRCREILDRKIDAIQAQLYKFRAESETDSQQTTKSESQYGRAVPQHLGEPLETIYRGTGHAEAEGRKRIEVAQAPSRNRTLESGEAGEANAGGGRLEDPIDGGSVGGVTARRDGQRTGGPGHVETPVKRRESGGVLGSQLQPRQTGLTAGKDPQSFAGGGGHGDPLAMERTGQRRGQRGSASEESQPGKPTSQQGPIDPVEPNRPQYGKSIADPEEKPLAGSTPAHQLPIKPQRVRFGPGAVPVTESRYQRYRREAQAYYDAMHRDIDSGHAWPVRECAGGCGCLVNGPLDKCRLCRARVISERHELEWEEANG